jgi:hypothetical protein
MYTYFSSAPCFETPAVYDLPKPGIFYSSVINNTNLEVMQVFLQVIAILTKFNLLSWYTKSLRKVEIPLWLSKPYAGVFSLTFTLRALVYTNPASISDMTWCFFKWWQSAEFDAWVNLSVPSHYWCVATWDHNCVASFLGREEEHNRTEQNRTEQNPSSHQNELSTLTNVR